MDRDRKQSGGTDGIAIPRSYDLVFIDPPFADNLYQRSIDILQKQQLLNADAVVYLETARHCKDIVVPQAWELHRDKVAGDVRARLYRIVASD